MTERVSPITNCWDNGISPSRLDGEAIDLFLPEDPDRDWFYSHHPYLTLFKGRYYAMWSNGWRHEDDVGQRVVYCTSADFAKWMQPEVLVPTARGKHSDLVRYPEGWHQHEGTLVAYYTQYEYEPDALVVRAGALNDGGAVRVIDG